MWHASVSSRLSGIALPALLWPEADAVLHGVGDAALGEWREVGDLAVHVRRRLTPEEIRAGQIGDVRDVRGTADGLRRLERAQRHLPPSAVALWLAELTGGPA